MFSTLAKPMTYPSYRGSAPAANPVTPNAPAVQGTSFVSPIPVAQLPMRPYDANVVPGAATGVPGRPVAGASGNPAVATDPSVPPPKNPYGQPRPLGVGQE